MASEKQESQGRAREVLEGLRAYLEEDEFLQQVVAWAWNHCPKFPQGPPTRWEHPLEFTKLHNQYRKMFEDRADVYLDQEGANLKGFLEEVAGDIQQDPGSTRSLLDALVASEDYLLFCKYMQQIAERRAWAEGRGFGPVVVPSDADGDDEAAREMSGGLNALE